MECIERNVTKHVTKFYQVKRSQSKALAFGATAFCPSIDLDDVPLPFVIISN